jgi:DNA-binding transcriptional ArsR family regulator
MTQRSVYRLDNERVLEMLAHPVRLRLLGLLRSEGPNTASGLARRVGESSGVTSYHLRRLAGAGLVEEDPERGTRRERWWRSAHEGTTYAPADFLGSPQAHRASVSLRREVNRWQQRLLDQWLAEEQDWDKAWVEAADSSDDVLTLTPAQAAALSAEIWEVVQRYQRLGRDSAAEPDAGRVVWFHHLVPVRGELPL